MEIRYYRHELEYCNILSSDNISEKDIEFLMITFKTPPDFEEYDYDNENHELVFYYHAIP